MYAGMCVCMYAQVGMNAIERRPRQSLPGTYADRDNVLRGIHYNHKGEQAEKLEIDLDKKRHIM